MARVPPCILYILGCRKSGRVQDKKTVPNTKKMAGYELPGVQYGSWKNALKRTAWHKAIKNLKSRTIRVVGGMGGALTMLYNESPHFQRQMPVLLVCSPSSPSCVLIFVLTFCFLFSCLPLFFLSLRCPCSFFLPFPSFLSVPCFFVILFVLLDFVPLFSCFWLLFFFVFSLSLLSFRLFFFFFSCFSSPSLS